MKIISVVGKVDSRSLVYPLARALSMSGLTGIITDDGAYRRLYTGKGNIGNVNGIDVSICAYLDDKGIHSLDNSGVHYDNLLVVSADYIHPESNGIIVCHGLDRSMLAQDEVEEDDDFILPVKSEAQKPEDANGEKKKSGLGRGKHKHEDKLTEVADNTESKETEAVEVDENPTTEENEPVEKAEDVETEHDRIIRVQSENRDKIVIPEGMPFTEVQIAFAATPKKGIPGISLKDGLVNYIYSCEEQKRISVIQDKNLNSIIVKLAADLLGMGQSELSTLLIKEEGQGAPDKSKKKK